MSPNSNRSYDYSPVHRVVEVCAIISLGVIIAAMGHEVVTSLLGAHAGHGWWLLAGSALLGYLVADFVSGFVHFLADTFGHEKLFFLGPAFIRPFREHHVDPRAITRHDFIETNGNNCIICIPTALTVYALLPAQTELWAAFALAFTAWFMVGIFMTNQFHKWAHLEEIPGWIARLQAWGLILSPEHHDVHHTPPFDRYYCITTGWMNPVLQRLRFFSTLEATLRFVFRSPKPPLPTPPRRPELTRTGPAAL